MVIQNVFSKTLEKGDYNYSSLKIDILIEYYETIDKTFDFTNLAEAFQSLDHSLGTKNLQLKILFSYTWQLKR